MKARKTIKLRALRTFQGEGMELYAFFIPGAKLLEIAKISRISRDDQKQLKGFQRKEIKTHVNRITEYLDRGNVLFPNAIILAMTSEFNFKLSKGRKPWGMVDSGEIGILEMPIPKNDEPVAWIVDGQQRSIALSKSKNSSVPVPVIAFVSDNIEVQREQFILVNKARPLPTRLINELLPTVQPFNLPRDLAPRRIPSELCNLLNSDRNSPLYGLIKRVSTDDNNLGVINDTSLIKVMKHSIRSPLGALSPFKGNEMEEPNIGKMYNTMILFWTSVSRTFPEAWGLQPTKSRLMHSAGIEAMGFLMDRIMSRASSMQDPQMHIDASLSAIAPYCRWTHGTWESIGLKWNQIQNTTKHIRLLADTLIQLDYKFINDR